MQHTSFILKIGVLCAFMVLMGALAKRQFERAWAMEADNAKLERKLRDVRLENQNLKKQAVALGKDAGIEREARRLGYVKEGESHLQIAAPSR